MVEQKAKKITEFEGYMSGDYECFCLSKRTFEKQQEHRRKLHEVPLKNKKAFLKWHKKLETMVLYPDDFFPEKCNEGKWRFKITVEAEKIG